ncbi:hypothetical protein PDE_09831 [Penicillium oxalicum 114-2]|uniref:Apple domain-containing protein n=1 Tax=Penicillium oxalicum (strain 114-2 / CGMCC 5302) TaxID=933388 RepID=S8BI08_PENO1|nr:hypothetical protein PDE_09831 [Penicillium oxalicum 114-2]
MNGTSSIHSHPRARSDDPGMQVVPGSEKEAISNDFPIYVFGPERPAKEEQVKLHSPKKTVCGLKPMVFWALLAVALLVIIGGAVGGGIGGTLATRHTSEAFQTSASSSILPSTMSRSTTTFETSTTKLVSTISSAPVSSGTTGIASNPCPGRNLTTVTGSDGSVFTLLCAVDWPSGVDASSGHGTVYDLNRSTRYTLGSCIADCVDWNDDVANDSKCKGIVYTANLTAAFEGGQGGNCFLKSAVGVYFPNSYVSMAAGILGG